MIAVKPITVSDSNLTSTIAEPDLTQSEVEWVKRGYIIQVSHKIHRSCYSDNNCVFYAAEEAGNVIYVYNKNFEYNGVSFSTSSETDGITGVTVLDGFIYVLSGNNYTVYEYSLSGVYTGVSFGAPNSNGRSPFSLGNDGLKLVISYSPGVGGYAIQFCSKTGNNEYPFQLDLGVDAWISGITISTRGLYLIDIDQSTGSMRVIDTDISYSTDDGAIITAIPTTGRQPIDGFTEYNGLFYSGSTLVDSIAQYDALAVATYGHPIGSVTIVKSEHKKYISNSINQDNPVIGAAKTIPTWTYVSPTNKFAMFDNGISTQTLAENSIIQTLTPDSLVDSISVFNMSGVSGVNITITVPSVGEIYNHDVEIADNSAVIDLWTYFLSPIVTRNKFVLLDIPPYLNQTIVVTFTGGTEMKVGELVLGNQIVLGTATDQTSVQLLDFSTQTRDTFGNFTVTKRGKADLVKFNVKIDENKVGYVRNQLVELAQQPIVWAGGGGGVDDASQVMGFYESFDDGLSASITFATITVQGLVYDA